MTIDTIRWLETARRQAMVARDIDALTTIMDPDGWYCHGTGERQTAAMWIESVRNRTFVYDEVSISDENIIIFSDTAIVTGTMSIKVLVSGDLLTTRRSIVDVWLRRGDAWRLAFYYGTMLAHGSQAELDAEIQAEVRRHARGPSGVIQ